ncbi:MAG TPA: aminotransferase class I/II-fold pyridoxal phosphate-dependent enzyme [Gemmatimonadales bacterium]|jgi:LL-diaminopimelate aminotransferase
MSRESRRLSSLPPYAVGELAVVKRKLLADGVDVIDLSVGDADVAPPGVAVEALARAAREPAMSRYAFQSGLREFREAAAAYMRRRFGVEVDPVTEILPLLGSKEGLAHLALAVTDPGDVCILPDPGYPAYIGGAVLSGAEPVRVPLRSERDFLLELDELPSDVLDRARLLYLNYPNNPTSAIAGPDYLARVVAVCREHAIVLAYDNPYVELTFDGHRAPSVLETDGAREVTLEFHSLSKSFSMTGWRIAFAVGNAELIAMLSRLKGFVDSGVFLAVQRAGAAALEHAEQLIPPFVALLTERRDALLTALAEMGMPAEPPRATMFVWVRVPTTETAAAFAQRVLERTGVLVLPGSAFGEGGEGYVRLALTVTSDRLREAAGRIGSLLARA